VLVVAQRDSICEQGQDSTWVGPHALLARPARRIAARLRD
jgi:hypothetical protein